MYTKKEENIILHTFKEQVLQPERLHPQAAVPCEGTTLPYCCVSGGFDDRVRFFILKISYKFASIKILFSKLLS